MQYRHEREQSEPAGTCEKQRYCSFSLSTAAGRGQRERARFHAYTASKRIYFFKFLHFAGEASESVPHLQTHTASERTSSMNTVRPFAGRGQRERAPLQTHTASERALKTKRETIFVQFLFFSWPNFRKNHSIFVGYLQK